MHQIMEDNCKLINKCYLLKASKTLFCKEENHLNIYNKPKII